jgi:hypothetical protein
MSNNRLLTRDNLEKRSLDDKRFMFCNEAESIHHIFFGCVVVSQAWEVVSKIVGFSLEVIMNQWRNVGCVISSLE